MDIEKKNPEAVITPKSEKAQFLSQFTAEDDRRIMRKVDRRVLLLMGIMYLLKQIDFTNAASVKVLQVGEPSNILTELRMSTNDYNWTQTIYYVRPHLSSHTKLTENPDRPRPLRSSQQPAPQTPNPPQMDDPHLPNLGHHRGLPRRHPKQSLLLRPPLPPRRPRSRLLPGPRRPNVRLVPQRRIQQTHHVDVRLPELLGDHRLPPGVWHLIHGRDSRFECLALGISPRGISDNHLLSGDIPPPTRLSQIGHVCEMAYPRRAGVSRTAIKRQRAPSCRPGLFNARGDKRTSRSKDIPLHGVSVLTQHRRVRA